PVGRLGPAAPGTERLGPEVERRFGAEPEGDRVHHPGARAPAWNAGVLEERDVRARAAALVRVKQVVHGGVVLVDRLLDEAQAEDACVEVHVAGSVGGDARHVVNAFELHGPSLSRDWPPNGDCPETIEARRDPGPRRASKVTGTVPVRGLSQRSG